MAQKEGSLVLTFNDGVTEDVVEDVADGAITISENTRLTRLKGTAVKAPGINVQATLGALECGGLVSNGRDSTVAYFRAGEANTARWSDGGLTALGSPIDGAAGQSAYYPYPLIEAGAVPGSLSSKDPVVVVDSAGRTWHFAARAYNGTSTAIYVTVLDGERVAVPPRFVTTDIGYWFGATANTIVIGSGVALWYIKGTTGAINYRFISIDVDGVTLSVGSEAAIVTPSTRDYADVISNGTDGFAYLLYQSAAANLGLERINVATGATTHFQSIPGVITAGDSAYFALAIHTLSGTEYVTAAYSDWTNLTGARHYSAAALGLVWQRNNIGTYGRVAVQPFVTGGDAFMCIAVDSFFTGTLGSGETATTFLSLVHSTGVVSGSSVAHWLRLHSRGGYRKVSDAAIYPYFPLLPCNQTDATYDTITGFVLDPSIDVYTLLDKSTPTPVMRCGVDRVVMLNPTDLGMMSGAAYVRDNVLTIAYLEQRAQDAKVGAAGYPTRYVKFDLAPSSAPPSVADERGSALIASGLVAYWDGAETAEHGPLHIPMVHVATSGGTGATNLTGTYSFTAVISWRDNNGLIRRSAPARPVLVTLAGTKPQVYVTARQSMRGLRLEEYDITVYATLVGGSTFYAQSYVATSKSLNGCWHFAGVNEPGSYNVRLYSTGAKNEPLTPTAPPPARSAAIVGPRCWLIDAEDPYRVLPSLIKEQGVAFEFNGALEIFLPPTYGKALAIADRGGQPLVFCERGVWTIGGYGPDNAGQGTGFAEPALVLPRGTRSGDTVVQLPGAGILFQGDDGRFCLIGSAFKSFDTFASTYEVGAPLVFQRENEVAYPRTNGTGWVAYNWVKDGWTHWKTNVEGSAPTACAITDASDGRTRALLYAASTGTFATLDSATETTLPLRVERGWIAPELPQGDCDIREVWVQCVVEAAHNLLVTVFFDYNDSLFVQQAWTADELAALNQSGRYTIGLRCEDYRARALKVRVEEVSTDADPLTGAGVRVLNATVFYGASDGPRRRTLLEGAMK